MNFAIRTIKTVFEKTKGNNLKAKASRGSLILATGTFLERGTRLVRNMILARLLAPSEFGLMAIIIAFSTAFEAFADIGVRQSIIHSKIGNQTRYLNVAWWFQTIRGIVLFVIAYLASPWISHFYENTELLPLMRVALVAILFRSLISPRAYVLEKEMKFGKWVFMTQGGSILGTMVTLSLVLFLVRNVWALVIGSVAEMAFQCLLSFILCPFLPRLSFDRNSLTSILKYSRGMLGLSLLTIVALQTDIIVLGKVVSTEQLGMYSLALALAQQPMSLFGQSIGRVLFSAFAERQDEKRFLCRVVIRMIRTTIVFGVPLIALIALFSGPILSVVYGPRYVGAALTFTILCVAMLFYVQAAVLSQIYMGIGMPYLHRRYVILLASLIICLIYPGIRFYGLAGAAGVLLFSHASAVCMQVIWMRNTIGLEFRDYISCWLPVHQHIARLGNK